MPTEMGNSALKLRCILFVAMAAYFLFEVER